MIAYILFLAFPFIILFLLGFKIPLKYFIIFTIVTGIIFLGFIFGLAMTWFVTDSQYWRSYEFPDLLTEAYKESLTWQDLPIKYMAIPFIFLVDLFRIYFHMNFTHGHIALYLGEAASYFILWNITKIYLALNSRE